MARPGIGVTEGVVSGWHAVRLTSDALSVTVLPGKGADIYEIVDLATGIDPLFKAPWGLQPPGAASREGSDGAAFLENYEGSWQELFPNTNAMPLRGAYGLGIEPWATGGNLEQAVADGTALRLAGQARLETRLTATIQDW